MPGSLVNSHPPPSGVPLSQLLTLLLLTTMLNFIMTHPDLIWRHWFTNIPSLFIVSFIPMTSMPS